jgi:hypothetical protein
MTNKEDAYRKKAILACRGVAWHFLNNRSSNDWMILETGSMILVWQCCLTKGYSVMAVRFKVEGESPRSREIS